MRTPQDPVKDIMDSNELLLKYLTLCDEHEELKKRCACCRFRFNEGEVPRHEARKIAAEVSSTLNSLVPVKFEEGGGHD